MWPGNKCFSCNLKNLFWSLIIELDNPTYSRSRKNLKLKFLLIFYIFPDSYKRVAYCCSIFRWSFVTLIFWNIALGGDPKYGLVDDIYGAACQGQNRPILVHVFFCKKCMACRIWRKTVFMALLFSFLAVKMCHLWQPYVVPFLLWRIMISIKMLEKYHPGAPHLKMRYHIYGEKYDGCHIHQLKREKT